MTSNTIFLRVPPALKKAIELAAKAAGQSLNTWMMRAAEERLKCTSHQPKE